MSASRKQSLRSNAFSYRCTILLAAIGVAYTWTRNYWAFEEPLDHQASSASNVLYAALYLAGVALLEGILENAPVGYVLDKWRHAKANDSSVVVLNGSSSLWAKSKSNVGANTFTILLTLAGMANEVVNAYWAIDLSTDPDAASAQEKLLKTILYISAVCVLGGIKQGSRGAVVDIALERIREFADNNENERGRLMSDQRRVVQRKYGVNRLDQL